MSQDDSARVHTPDPIPEPPSGSPAEIARRAWQVAWSASNAAAKYHADILKSLVNHEKNIKAELSGVRSQIANDFDNFRRLMLQALTQVGIQIDLSPSGNHLQRVSIVEGGAIRERVASSHDLAIVGERIEERIDERLEDLSRDLRPSTSSDRVKELISHERARIEAEQKVLRLEMEKSQQALAHAGEIKRIEDQRVALVESNNRWLRIAFLIAGGVVTVLGALLVWSLTKHAPTGQLEVPAPAVAFATEGADNRASCSPPLRSWAVSLSDT